MPVPRQPELTKRFRGKARGVRTINTIAKHPGMLVGATDTFTLCSPIGTVKEASLEVFLIKFGYY